MLKTLFLGMLEVSSHYYGDSIGLAPIALGKSGLKQKNQLSNDFWDNECSLRPARIACLNYDN